MTREEFVARIQAVSGLDSAKEAERWAKVVGVALLHLLSHSDARRHFISQMPGFLKSHLLSEPTKALLMGREALLQHVGAALGTHATEAERALRSVYRVLREAVSPGEMASFEAHLARDVSALLAAVH